MNDGTLNDGSLNDRTSHASEESAAPTGSHGSRVSAEEVRHVAALANLELTEDELQRMARDLDAVLGYIVQLDELDTANVAPMAQVADSLGTVPAAAGESLRTDAVRPSIDRSLVMRDAPETDGRFFKVPKVIER